MRIASSDIALQSQRSYLREEKETTNLRMVKGNRELNVSTSRSSTLAEQSSELGRTVVRSENRAGGPGRSEEAPGRANGNPTPGAGRPTAGMLDALNKPVSKEVDGDDASMDPKMQLTKMLMEKVFGKHVRFSSMKFEMAEIHIESFTAGQAAGGSGSGSPPPPRGDGLAYDRIVSRHEAESTQFSAQGKVTTSDGKQIDFNLALNMSRDFTSTEQVSLRSGSLKDPLVVNFAGKSAELADARFAFDLDSDGTSEQVHFLKQGSGFLAFDKNGDGSINNGSELFGTQSGDGFADLAAYDEDGNQFIDEGDSIYSSLSLYNKDANGQDQLVKLSDAGVGAIYLKSAGTQFSLNNTSDNSQKGQVRSSGIYLGEDGHVGSVQQIDLVQFESPEAATAPAQEGIAVGEPAPEAAAAPELAHLDVSA